MRVICHQSSCDRILELGNMQERLTLAAMICICIAIATVVTGIILITLAKTASCTCPEGWTQCIQDADKCQDPNSFGPNCIDKKGPLCNLATIGGGLIAYTAIFFCVLTYCCRREDTRKYVVVRTITVQDQLLLA
jgi:hypothetical protein